ncbi:MAG: EAL domain-containing protein [Proteobacteria bacterium]|nr:EAL domain-containing protein [Pseudomonadota bacterium]
MSANDQQEITGNDDTTEPLISDADLAIGVRDNQFVMHYQPKIDTRTLEFVSVEALIRWIHPVLGMVMPDSFIPLAEQGQHIHGITDIVLKTALKQSAQWRELGLDLRMSINISGASLEVPDLPERIHDVTNAFNVPADKIVLEVTETWQSKDTDTALDILNGLSAKGFGLALDDVGTGHSNFSKLQGMPYSEMKLDKSHIQSATIDQETRQFIAMCVELGHEMGMYVVAEGIESQDQWEMMSAMGCDEAQGFFIARPMPGDQIPGWLKRWNRYLGLAENHQRASGQKVNLDEMTGTFHRLNSIFPTKLDI